MNTSKVRRKRSELNVQMDATVIPGAIIIAKSRERGLKEGIRNDEPELIRYNTI